MKLTADNEAINYLKDCFNKDFIEMTVDGEKKIFVSEEKLKEKDIQIEFLKEEKQLQIKDNQELFEKSINEMAEMLSKRYCFAPIPEKCNQSACDFDKSKCIPCIIEYFTNKVEREGK